MNRYRTLAACLAFLLCAGCSAGTGSSQGGSSASVSSQSASSAARETSAPTDAAADYDEEDLDAQWDEASAVRIALEGASASVGGAGATADGGTVTITAAGTYILSGTLDDGQIIVDADKNDLVRLVLSGAHITSQASAPIYAKQADKLIVTLAGGTENTLADAAQYVYPDAAADEPDAALFSKDDLTINGAGRLTVTGSYKNGIGTKDDLVITGGEITVTAANDGLRGRDAVRVGGGTLTVDAGGDAIQSNNDEDAQKGLVAIDGGTFRLTAAGDGIQAETSLQITGGDFTITTGGGAANAPAHAEGFGRQQTQTDTAESNTVSSKALKSGTSLGVSGGTFAIDASDDAVHTNGDAAITGGTFTISTGDDGFHADAALTVDGGEIGIETCYEGLEGMSVTVNGGTVRLHASDDGVNAAGGSDGERAGQDPFSASGDCVVRVTGGYLYVDAKGDGLDSNGDLYLEGGTVAVSGPTSGGDGMLDFNGTFEITGGVLAGAGSSAMLQTPAETSAQPSLTVLFTSTRAAGTLVYLADADGNTVAAFAPQKEFQSLAVSSPALETGGTYTLYEGGTAETNEDGWATAASGGEKLCEVTLASAVTLVNEDGSAASVRTMGGGRGGMDGGRGFPADGSMPEGTPPDGEAFPDDGVPPDGGMRRGKRGETATSTAESGA